MQITQCVPGASYCAAGANRVTNMVTNMTNAVGSGICTAGYAVTGAAALVINKAVCFVQNNPKAFLAGAGLTLVVGTALAYRAGKFATMKDSACHYCEKAKTAFEGAKAWFPITRGAHQAQIDARDAEIRRIKLGVRVLATQLRKDPEVILPMEAPTPTPESPKVDEKDPK